MLSTFNMTEGHCSAKTKETEAQGEKPLVGCTHFVAYALLVIPSEAWAPVKRNILTKITIEQIGS